MAVLVTNGQQLAGTQVGFIHFQSIGVGSGHGLLANDVLACLHGSHRDLAVLYIGSQHVDSINIRVFQQFPVVGEHLGAFAAIFRTGFLCPLRDNVAESIHIDPVPLGSHTGEMFVIGDTAASDEADL